MIQTNKNIEISPKGLKLVTVASALNGHVCQTIAGDYVVATGENLIETFKNKHQAILKMLKVAYNK